MPACFFGFLLHSSTSHIHTTKHRNQSWAHINTAMNQRISLKLSNYQLPKKKDLCTKDSITFYLFSKHGRGQARGGSLGKLKFLSYATSLRSDLISVTDTSAGPDKQVFRNTSARQVTRPTDVKPGQRKSTINPESETQRLNSRDAKHNVNGKSSA